MSDNVDKLLLDHENNLSGLKLDSYDFSGRDLTSVNFSGASLVRCNFRGCNLSFADFSWANLYRADLSETTLYVTNFFHTDLTRARFRDARLYGMKIFDAVVTLTEFDEMVVEERWARTREDFRKASRIYNALKRTYQENRLLDEAAKFYYRERCCRRKGLESWLARLGDYIFAYALFGYGERPFLIFAWAALTIVLAALIYLILPEIQWSWMGESYIYGSGGILSLHGVASLQDAARVFATALYFSACTLLNLDPEGFGAIGVAGAVHWMEGWAGVILFGLGIVAYTRRVIRD